MSKSQNKNPSELASAIVGVIERVYSSGLDTNLSMLATSSREHFTQVIDIELNVLRQKMKFFINAKKLVCDELLIRDKDGPGRNLIKFRKDALIEIEEFLDREWK